MAARGRAQNTAWIQRLCAAGCALLAFHMLWPRAATPARNCGSTDAHARSAKAKVKIGWVGHVFGERPPSGLSVTEAVSVATNNFGNLVWAYSAWKLVDPNATELVPLIAPPFSTPVDAVLLPTANMLVNSSKYKDVEDYTRILVNIVNGISPQTAPIMLIAIGSQVEFEETPGVPSSIEAAAATGAGHIVLDPEQISFLQRIKASGGMMTTRGRFTEQIIAANGLPPPLPLSCPSLFLNHVPRLGATLQQKWDAVLQQRDPNLRLAITLPNIPADDKGREKYAEVVRFLAEHILKPYRKTATVILQTMWDVDTLEIINVKYGVHLRPDRIRHFYDVDAWVEGMKSCCDFVFGFRIHGTVVGACSGLGHSLIAGRSRRIWDAWGPYMAVDNKAGRRRVVAGSNHRCPTAALLP
jgi:hypothetical protein